MNSTTIPYPTSLVCATKRGTSRYRLCHHLDGVHLEQAFEITTPDSLGGIEQSIEWEEVPLEPSKPLTDRQLEIVAKEYCRLLGKDPKELVPYQDEHLVMLRRPYWVSVLFELKSKMERQNLLRQAISIAMSS